MNLVENQCCHVTVTINNTCLNRVKSITFLGIVLDELLSFKEHIAFVARGINRVNGMLYKRRDLLPENCRRQLYFALVNNRINYGIEVYGSAKWSALKCVYVACNRVLRTLQNRDRYCNVKLLYKTYDILPVNLLHKLSTGRIIYKCLMNCTIVPNAIKNMFIQNRALHNYNTRLLETNYLFTNLDTASFNSLVFISCYDWNRIPIEIRNLVSFNSFSRTYKCHLHDPWIN